MKVFIFYNSTIYILLLIAFYTFYTILKIPTFILGNNPLQGPNDTRFGPRFPPMSKAYDRDIIKKAKQIAVSLGMTDIVREGVYTCLGGPNFETIAELNMLRLCGVDAVGMSTVHEVITAKHCDMTVFAFSLITNECIVEYEDDTEACHEEVMDVGRGREDVLKRFVAEIVNLIGPNIENGSK